MAGRILPIALATVAGISIGVATFDGEFKEQRKKKLEREYHQEVAALASKENNVVPSSSSATPSTSTPGALPLPPANQSTVRMGEVEVDPQSKSSWSSMLGVWAWKKDKKLQVQPGAANSSTEEMKKKPS